MSDDPAEPEVLFHCPWCGEDMRPAPVHADNPPDLVCENGHEWWDDDYWEEDE